MMSLRQALTSKPGPAAGFICRRTAAGSRAVALDRFVLDVEL
jgi:hypothetical protein